MSINNKIKHTLYEKYKEVVVSLTNPISRSEFQDSGKITPQEFVDAGDMLVQKFPAWEWRSGPASIQPSLPNNKKFLKLSKVISKNRPSFEDTVSTHYDEWEITESINKCDNNKKNIDVIDLDEDETDEIDETESFQSNKNLRMYDLTIIYDQYYATPRLYLIGYNYESIPLSGNEMMDDVYLSNREKTVTIETHPFLKTPCISIHPCRHAETLKRIMKNMEDRITYEQQIMDLPNQPQINFYFPASMCLFIFLKFMSSVIPTIEYDASLGIDI
jgi:ubiquitin-like-conjugating enzyme ATG3